MIASTYNSTSIYVINDAIDWGGRFRAQFSVVANFEAGLSNRETRRAYSGTLRTSVDCTVVAHDSGAIALDSALRDYQSQPVVLPFWPGVVEWGNRSARQITGGLYIVWKRDWSTWEIYESTEPSWPTNGDLVAPALWGRFEDRSLQWVSATLCTLSMSFVDDGPASWALSAALASLTAGPLPPAGYSTAPKIFPLRADFTDGVSDSFTANIIRNEDGFTRGPYTTLYAQTNAEEVETSHVAVESGVGSLLYFWKLHAGGAPFWMPKWVMAAKIASAVGASDTVINVQSGHSIRSGDYVAFCSPGVSPICRRVTAKTSTTITIDSAIGAIDFEDYFVSRCLLSRCASPKLSATFESPLIALVSFPVREVPEEYAAASGETIGSTIGALPTRAYLYEFARVLNGSTFTERVTSYEADLTYGGFTYTSTPISHGEISSGLSLDFDELEVSTRTLAITALQKMVTLQAPSPVKLTLTQVDVSSGTGINAVVLFTGEVIRPTVRGDRCTFKVSPGGSIWEQNVPGFRLQPACNHTLFSSGCRLVSSDWKFTATLTAVGTPGYPFSFDLGSLTRVTGAAPTYFNHWFALGFIEFGSGSSWQRRQIVDSTTVTAGALTVYLDSDPSPFPSNGDPVVLYPGCDLKRETCKAYNAGTNPTGKFNNYANFGGFPFIPSSNPSLVKLSNSVAGGKK